MLIIPTLSELSIEVYFILIILAIPTFFTWNRFLKKLLKTNNIRKSVALIATVIVTPIMYTGIIMLLIFSITFYIPRHFDQETWIQNKETRYKLSEDIIESNVLIGKTKLEVRQLLGDENNTDNSYVWHYNLGLRPGIANIDPDVLEIEFKDDIVIKVTQYES